MKAVVVYESLWGNTAAIARVIAEGIGPEAQALSTAEASAGVLESADLVVAGAPLMAFSLPRDEMRQTLGAQPRRTSPPPDLSHPSMRSWLDALAEGEGHGRSAAFETRFWWSPGSSASLIDRGLVRAGFRPVDGPHRFIVVGKCGPLRGGEIERARRWGTELAARCTGG